VLLIISLFDIYSEKKLQARYAEIRNKKNKKSEEEPA
jgi:hypothetical protein